MKYYVVNHSSMFVKMSMPVFYKCSPCKYHYDAVIDMDFFDEHSRFGENVICMDLKKRQLNFRIILEAAGVGGWVSDSHFNDNGAASAEKSRVHELFSGSDTSVIQTLVRRYYPDFRLCGYLDTLSEFEDLLKKRSSTTLTFEGWVNASHYNQ